MERSVTEKRPKNPFVIFLDKLETKQKDQYKNLEEVSLARAAWELERDRDEAKKRENLSVWLRWISISWLVFSAVVIVLCGFGILQFGQETIITFIAGSLLEVFGLWKIALNYFFGRK